MADGPLDYGSGYFFEPQKGISDRRAARGLGQAATRSNIFGKHTSSGYGVGVDGGGGLLETIIKGVLWLAIVGVIASGFAAFLIAKFVLAPLIMWLIARMFGGRR